MADVETLQECDALALPHSVCHLAVCYIDAVYLGGTQGMSDGWLQERRYFANVAHTCMHVGLEHSSCLRRSCPQFSKV